jgi:DNA/RNA endonuclease YhcR with UshA esterase domain
MRKRLIPLVILGGLLAAAAPVFAHHSFSAEYDINKPITLKGTLVKMEWVNPHGWIHITVKDDNGTLETWDVEFGAPTSLLKRGLRKTDFPEGIEVTVSGYRAKNGTRTVNGSSVKLPDGRTLFTGSSGGDGGPPGAKQ